MNRILLCAAILSLHFMTASAQLRVKAGNDSPLRKLQIAELAVNGLYVDSVAGPTLHLFHTQGSQGDERASARQLRGHRRTV